MNIKKKEKLNSTKHIEKNLITNNMEIEITVNGITRVYKGDFDTLYNNEWDEVIRDLIETTVSEEKSYEKA